MNTKVPTDPLVGLGANERAVLQRVPTLTLRRLAAAVVHLKVRLQFTGWLQYVIPLAPASGLTLLAGVCWLLGLSEISAVFGGLSALLLALVAFDVVTVKLKLHPPEAHPRPNTHLDDLQLMRSRRSCRSFPTRAMGDADRRAVLDAVAHYTSEPTLGPTPVRLEFIQAPLTVWPVVNATEFLIAVLPKPYDRRSIIDVGRVLQKVVLDATRRGLATCWIGPGASPESLAHHLGDRFDPNRDMLIVTCAVGYASAYVPLFIRVFSRLMRRRLPLEALFFADAELTQPIAPAAVVPFGPALEACRWGPSSYNGQTTRAVIHTRGGGLHHLDFFASTASRYYAPVALGIWCANWELGSRAIGEPGRFTAQPPPSAPLEPPHHDVSWTRG